MFELYEFLCNASHMICALVLFSIYVFPPLLIIIIPVMCYDPIIIPAILWSLGLCNGYAVTESKSALLILSSLTILVYYCCRYLTKFISIQKDVAQV
jgi:hypothetical protein